MAWRKTRGEPQREESRRVVKEMGGASGKGQALEGRPAGRGHGTLGPGRTDPVEQANRAHREAGHQGSLQEADEDVTPVVLVVGHPSIAHIDRKGHQEELNGGPQQPRPLPAEPGLHVQLSRHQPASAGPVVSTARPAQGKSHKLPYP